MRTHTSLTPTALVLVAAFSTLIVDGALQLAAAEDLQSGSLLRQTMTQVPIGYDPQPARPALSVHRPAIGGEGFVVGITNRASTTLAMLQYVAIVETVGWRVPVRVLMSDRWTLTLAPGERAELNSGWLKDSELVTLTREASGPIQIFLAPAYARYADGSEWRAEVDYSAKDSRVALGFRH